MPDPLTIPLGSDMTLDPLGPDSLTVFLADDLHVELDEDAITVDFCAIGLPGRDGADGAGADIEAVASGDLSAGTPVAIDRATGKFIAGDAAWKPAAFVAGLLRADVASGFVGAAATTQLTLADWSAVTGAVSLAPGVLYFLGTGGGLTTIAPASDCVVLVGKALNASTLLIDPQPPIQL